MTTIDFDSIKERHPLAKYCQERGIELHRNGSSSELVGLCPLHPEKTGSFHVYPDNHYHCYGCGAHGDVTDLEQALRGGTRTEAAARLGAEPMQDVTRREPPIHRAQKKAEARPNLSGIEPCTDGDLKQIAELRCIPIEGLRIAVNRRMLFAYNHLHQGRCFVITDDARRCAISRKFDGKPFRDQDPKSGEITEKKSKCWYRSEANWPIGIAQSSGFPAIPLCEGMPDFLAAFALAYDGAVERLVAPVCMTGASCSLHKDALPLFRAKRVRIFGHADETGQNAIQRWAEQLRSVEAEVDGFDFSGLVKSDGSPVKDLNDFLLVDRSASECPPEILTGIMDFALERQG